MIFTTRPIQMRLLTPSSPINDFMSNHLIDTGKDNYKRENYFIRYIGFDQSQNAYLKQLKEMHQGLQGKKGYLCVQGLNRQFPVEETNKLITMYEAWLQNRKAPLEQLMKLTFPMHFKNAMLELTQKVAFEKVMTYFEQKNPSANASIKKNFGVSLLGLSGYYLPKLFNEEALYYGKIVYIGEIKRQELLFLYFLNLLGCDILYLNPKEDIVAKYPECESFSTLYRGKEIGTIDVMKELQQKAVTVSSVPQRSQIQQQPQVQTPSQAPGSIHLGHPHQNAQNGNTQRQQQASQPHNIAGRQTTTMQRQATPVKQQTTAPQRQAAPVKQQTTALQRQTSQPVRPINGLERPHTNSTAKRELSYEELARLSTSVVMIAVADERGKVLGTGSGVVINANGYILTNYHVVKHGTRYFIKFENENDAYETRRIVKYHPQFDLAIIKVERSCKPIPVYSGNDIVRGQKVVAIGSPLGLFNSISDGIVSAFRNMEDGSTMIQFTAPISHGSSGGALLDLYGNLIGISTAGYDDGQNLNLAVNSESIRFFAGNYINQ